MTIRIRADRYEGQGKGHTEGCGGGCGSVIRKYLSA